MIDIQSATRRYGDVLAVEGVRATITRGEVVGLLGHNGAGKTTLMKMLTGVLEPTAGKLTVAGHDVVTERIEAQRHVGYLPESAPLYPEMTVYAYLQMMADLRGIPRREQAAAVRRAIDATGLEKRIDQPIHELSKGFRQRVGIAQAIVHQPAVLILDEPTNGLDPVQIESIRELVLQLAQTTTIILSTHILQEVEAVCDRVVILIQGRLVEDAPLAELLTSERVTLSVRGEQVHEGLETLATGIVEQGPDPLHEDHIRLVFTPRSAPLHAIDEVLELARTRGWSVAGIGREERTLEGVFKELQAAHAREART